MAEPASPQHVVETLMQGISDRNWSRLHELYAEEAGIEYPFALPAPRRIEGRAAIRDYFAVVAAAPLRLQTRNMVVHRTANPEVVVVEWDYAGLVSTTGRSFHVSNVQVTRVRDGRIVASRDYHNHAIMAAVLDRLPALLAALTEGKSETGAG